MRWMLAVLFAVCVVSFGVCAADAIPVTAAVNEAVDKPSIIISILHYLTDIILGGFLALFGLGFKWLIGKAGENAARIQAIEALHAGVESAWNECGKEWKQDSEDGKLTNDEKKKLRDLAIKKALEVAKGPGKDLLLNWGKEILESKIRAIVDSRKKSATSVVTEVK